MNRISPAFKLSKAIPGFIQHKAAQSLSPRTLVPYAQHLNDFLQHHGDIRKIKAVDIRAHLVWLQTEYKPRRMTGGDQPLSGKTIHNIWMTLAAFFTWLSREFDFARSTQRQASPARVELGIPSELDRANAHESLGTTKARPGACRCWASLALLKIKEPFGIILGELRGAQASSSFNVTI